MKSIKNEEKKRTSATDWYAQSLEEHLDALKIMDSYKNAAGLSIDIKKMYIAVPPHRYEEAKRILGDDVNIEVMDDG